MEALDMTAEEQQALQLLHPGRGLRARRKNWNQGVGCNAKASRPIGPAGAKMRNRRWGPQVQHLLSTVPKMSKTSVHASDMRATTTTARSRDHLGARPAEKWRYAVLGQHHPPKRHI